MATRTHYILLLTVEINRILQNPPSLSCPLHSKPLPSGDFEPVRPGVPLKPRETPCTYISFDASPGFGFLLRRYISSSRVSYIGQLNSVPFLACDYHVYRLGRWRIYFLMSGYWVYLSPCVKFCSGRHDTVEIETCHKKQICITKPATIQQDYSGGPTSPCIKRVGVVKARGQSIRHE